MFIFTAGITQYEKSVGGCSSSQTTVSISKGIMTVFGSSRAPDLRVVSIKPHMIPHMD